jgi:hypothetical protein
MLPLQFAVYKGTGGKHGAAQFNLQLPHYYMGKRKDFTGTEAMELDETTGRMKMKEGWKLREGAIFLEITSAKGPNIYDWETKITMALSTDDMGKVMQTLVSGEECKLMHDPGAKSDAQGAVKKYFSLSSPQGLSAGVILSVTQVSGGEKRVHTVPFSASEVLVLRALFQAAIARSLAWT